MIGLQGNVGPILSHCNEAPHCLASSAALGKADTCARTARRPAGGVREISWGKGVDFSAWGLQPWRTITLQLETVTWEGVLGVDFSWGSGAWHSGCCSKVGPGALKGRGSQERRQADSLGTPFSTAGLALLRHTRAPALVHGDKAS